MTDIHMHLIPGVDDGAEDMMMARIMDQVLENLNTGRYPTMNDTRYVLMEFYGGVEEDNALSCVEAMVNGGYQPIIAHMERYKYLRNFGGSTPGTGCAYPAERLQPI